MTQSYSPRYRHYSEDIESIRDLFDRVEHGYISASQAFRSFLSAFGGYYIYVPKDHKPKAERIVILLEEGLSPSQISERLGVTTRWVNIVRVRNSLK